MEDEERESGVLRGLQGHDGAKLLYCIIKYLALYLLDYMTEYREEIGGRLERRKEGQLLGIW